MMYEKVRRALVMAGEKQGELGEKYLVAYIIADAEIKPTKLRSFLAASLPEYMIPAYYVQLKSFPVTANGKLDKKALPAPEIREEQEYTAASSAMEQKLVEVWAELLDIGKEKISVNRSFFELGGNSLKIIRLKSILNTTMGWNLSIPHLFRYPTISALLSSIGQEDGDGKVKDKKAREEVSEMEDFINMLN
jgi:hypothetical protein